jgi:class 3 adenylate cyclase
LSEVARKIAVIVALDVAGYSARTEADETGTAAAIASLRSFIEAAASKHGGRIFNTAGDGFMLEFASSTAAVEAAAELALYCEPRVRVGVHLGDVVLQANGDLLGHGVNVAARLMALAEPGSALVSADVRRTIRGTATVTFEERGILKLDKMTETVEAFALLPPGARRAYINRFALGATLRAWTRVGLTLLGATLSAIALVAAVTTTMALSSLKPSSQEEQNLAIGPNCYHWATDFVVRSFTARKQSDNEALGYELTTKLQNALRQQGLLVFSVDTNEPKAHVPGWGVDGRGRPVRHLVCSTEGRFTAAVCKDTPNQLSITITVRTAQGAIAYSGAWCGPPTEIVDTSVAEAALGIAKIASSLELTKR